MYTCTYISISCFSDVNDKTPVFGSNPYSASVPEADAIGTTVTTIAATDGDTGVNGKMTVVFRCLLMATTCFVKKTKQNRTH